MSCFAYMIGLGLSNNLCLEREDRSLSFFWQSLIFFVEEILLNLGVLTYNGGKEAQL